MIKEHAKKVIEEMWQSSMKRMNEALLYGCNDVWSTAFGESMAYEKVLQVMSDESIDAIPRWHLTSRAQDYEMIELHQEAKLIRDLVEFYDNIPKEKLDEFV